jgi:hypothetical protein
MWCAHFRSGFQTNPGQAGGTPETGASPAGSGRESRTLGDVMKKAYEAPTLNKLGTFRKKTGLLRRSGNDRLILSKN